MNAYEEFALGNFLADYRDDLSFDEIITRMNNNDIENSNEDYDYDEIVTPWEPFEHETLVWLAVQIVNMHNSLLESFIPRPKSPSNKEYFESYNSEASE